MNTFYKDTDQPSAREKDAMWTNIVSQLPKIDSNTSIKSENSPAKIIEWRSFVFGNVAALMLIFSLYGAFSLVRDLRQNNAMNGNELAMDYSSAIESLNDVPLFLTDQTSQEMQQSIDSRFEGIREIDRIIQELRKDIQVNGATESKQRQLRRMYAMKMDMLKEIMLQGDFAL